MTDQERAARNRAYDERSDAQDDAVPPATLGAWPFLAVLVLALLIVLFAAVIRIFA